MSDPIVSVVLPFYRNPLVREAVDSILAQTFTDFELIAIDDCSGNGVAELLRDIADPRLRIVVREENGGENVTRNHGVELARGRYIAFQDHDDISYPDRLAVQVAHLESHPEVLGCGAACHYGDDKVLHTAPQDPRDLWWSMIFNNHVMFPTVMVRTEVARRHPFGNLVATEDYRWLYLVMSEGSFVNLPDVVFHYRMQATSLSLQKAELQTANLDLYRARFADTAAGLPEDAATTSLLRWMGTPRFSPWDSVADLRSAATLLGRLLEGFEARHPGPMDFARSDALGRLRFAATVSARWGLPAWSAYRAFRKRLGLSADLAECRLAAKCLLGSLGLLPKRGSA